MTDIDNRVRRRRVGYLSVAACSVTAGAIALFAVTQPAGAAVAPVGLGTARSFAVLAGSTVTNTGPSQISGDLGVSPGSAVTGFPPGIVTSGTIHIADGVAGGAQADLTTAYNDAAGRVKTASAGSFIGAGQSLSPGVYQASSSLEVGGALILNAHNDPNAVFIFQAPASTLTTDTGTHIFLTNGAQACNVFWQVGSSATLNTGTTFQGTILALTSISVLSGDTIYGRALARNGAVTLINDTIIAPGCRTTPPPTPTPTATTPTPTPTATTPTPTPTHTRPIPTPTHTTPTPTPTHTRPLPTPTRTGPIPTPTRTRPTPVPTRTRPFPTPTGTRPFPTLTPTPTRTRPAPTPTATHPRPAPTSTSPKPAPTSTKPAPTGSGSAPVPTPVNTTLPVTG
jgi:type VI secretion system secreted protein VgrG